MALENGQKNMSQVTHKIWVSGEAHIHKKPFLLILIAMSMGNPKNQISPSLWP